MLTGDKKKKLNRKIEALHILHKCIISYLFVDFPQINRLCFSAQALTAFLNTSQL